MASYKCSTQTKDLIIESASRLFCEKGYNAATIRDICHQSHISISRINYHFSSKAELARVICNQFLQNFSGEVQKRIGSRRNYSLVTESIAMRFLVSLLVGDPATAPSCRFYQEIAREGILVDAFTTEDENFFTRVAMTDLLPTAEYKKERVEVYSQIFASALSAVIRSWNRVLEQCGGNRDQALVLLQDIYVALFMQMLDFPHDEQKGILAMSAAYYQLMQVEIIGLTDVKITMRKILSEDEEYRLMKPIFGSSKK